MDTSPLVEQAGGFNNDGILTRDNLIANSEIQPIGEVATITGGAALARGTVLGKITSGGKLQTSLTAAMDGSQNVYAVLAQDADASAADVQAVVYIFGHFNSAYMTFGTGWTAATAKPALRDLGIYI